MIQKKIPKNDFAYAVGVIRTLETLLLSENEVDRMLLAPTVEEAFRILNETDYANNTENITDPAEFQKIIDKGLIEIHEKLEQITPDKRILNIIWMGYDFHNIKTMLKAKLSGKSFEDIENILSKMGKIDIIKLKDFIFDNVEQSWDLYPRTEKYLKKRILDVQDLFKKTKENPQVIDLYLDQKMMKIIYGKAEDAQSDFLKNYIRLYIDLNNIRLFFRMKATDKDIQLYEHGFLWNGTNTWPKMKEAYKDGLEKFPEFMKFSKYHKIVEQGYKKYVEDGTLIYLEKEIENYLLDYIKAAKYMPFGPEALIAYFLAKQNNALIIRMILINKLNKIDPEQIRDRLRVLYF